MKYFARLLALLIFIAVPTTAVLAAGGLVPCDGPECDLCSFVSLAQKILNFLVLAAVIIATIMFAYVGFEMLVHSDNSGQVAKARGIFLNVLIGLIAILASWLVIDTVMRVLFTYDNGFDNTAAYGKPWQDILCSYRSDTPPTTVTVGTVTTGTATGGGGGGCTVQTDGACSVDALTPVFGDAASQASQICSAESASDPNNESRVDRIVPTGESFSIGLFQINMTVHDLTAPACKALNGGNPLDCSQADTAVIGPPLTPPAFTGRNYSARITNSALYAACVAALKNPACNIQTAKQIYIAGGEDGPNTFSQWSTHKTCHIP